MGSADEIYVVLFEETLDDGLAEGITDATVILTPAALTFLRVRPEQVTQQAVLRNLSRTRNLLKLSHGNELG